MDYFIFQNLPNIFSNTEVNRRKIEGDEKEREIVNEYIGIFGKINGLGLAYYAFVKELENGYLL